MVELLGEPGATRGMMGDRRNLTNFTAAEPVSGSRRRPVRKAGPRNEPNDQTALASLVSHDDRDA
jgi:hypothetical protein